MASNQPNTQKLGRQILIRETLFRHCPPIPHFLTSHFSTEKSPQGITKHRPQKPIWKSARPEAIQHLEMPANSPSQAIQQNPFPSLSTSNTHTSVHPLLVIMLPLKTDRKKSVYRTYGLASL